MITCQFEDGGKAKLRHVTVNAIVIKDGKVLLAKRGTYNGGKPMLEGGKWGLIGGFLGRDESVQEALKREVKEETGYEIDNLQLFHIKDNPYRPAEDRQNVEFVFLVEGKETDHRSDEEVTQLQWFTVDELPEKESIAFDHGDDLELYKKYVKEQFELPVMGKTS